MAFDPDAYLNSEPAAPAFDPDAYLGAKPAPKPVSESVARGGLQGLSLGWGDEGAAAIAATLPFTDREAVAPHLADLVTGNAGNTWADRYRRAREFYRAQNEEAKKENPRAFTTGEIGGGLATAVVPAGGAAKGLGLGAKILRGAATGAGVGGVYGAGASNAEKATDVVREAAGGAALGGATGGTLPVLGAGLKWAAAPVAKYLRGKAIESGRKALSGIGTSLSARKEIPEEVVQQAIDTGAIKPLGTVKGAASRLAAQAEALGPEYGRILRDLEAQGVAGPNAELMARQALARAAEAKRVVARADKKEFEALAQELREAVPSTPFASRRLGLNQAEQIKRNLQEEAKREYDKITRQTTLAGEAKKKSAAMMRQAIEDAVSEQADKAPEAAAAFEPVKQKLSRTLQGLRVAEEGAARAARRKHVSLTDTIVASAAGAASHNPIVGVLSGLAHGVVDRRLASTSARGADYMAKLLEQVAAKQQPTASSAGAQRIAQLLAAMQRRGAPGLAPAGADEEAGP